MGAVIEPPLYRNMSVVVDKETEFLGCQSHSCYLEKPKGMGTNGPCRCLDKLDIQMRMKVRLTLQRLRSEIKSTQ